MREFVAQSLPCRFRSRLLVVDTVLVQEFVARYFVLLLHRREPSGSRCLDLVAPAVPLLPAPVVVVEPPLKP